MGEWIDRIGWPRFFELTGFAFTKHHLDTWTGARKIDEHVRASPLLTARAAYEREESRLRFGIVVNEGPYTHQASDSALQFVEAALAKGHEIFRVFFYHDGVNNGTRLTVPPQDDRNLQRLWSELR